MSTHVDVPGSSRGPSSAKSAEHPRRHVTIVATGGTIAGAGDDSYRYAPGELSVEDLISAVPSLEKLADVGSEQFSNVASQDIDDRFWLELAERVNVLLAQPGEDAVIITHGTDTLEETAYFLNLVVKSDKPVIVVGAMRPATALGADGPANLYNAVATAVDPRARGRGVLVVMNDKIHHAREVVKSKTTAVDTFVSANRGPAGIVLSGTITWFPRSDRKHTTASELTVDPETTKLPAVEIVYAHANMGTTSVDAALASGARGVVVAGVGNGNMPKKVSEKLVAAAKRGVVVVRSTRLDSGLVLRNNEVDDDAAGFCASGELPPAKAAVLLSLALLRTRDTREVQRLLDEH